VRDSAAESAGRQAISAHMRALFYTSSFILLMTSKSSGFSFKTCLKQFLASSLLPCSQ